MVVVTSVSILAVILILGSFIMDNGLGLTFRNLVKIHADHPSLFMVDLIPLFILAFLMPMHRIMNRAISDYEERVKESNLLLKRNTGFAHELSEGDNPKPYKVMMD